jgi:hypothetical protein
MEFARVKKFADGCFFEKKNKFKEESVVIPSLTY